MISIEDAQLFLGMIVDIIPEQESNMLLTMTVDDVTSCGIVCKYWERYLEQSPNSNTYSYDDGSDEEKNPGIMDLRNIKSIVPTKMGFKYIQHIIDTDLGI